MGACQQVGRHVRSSSPPLAFPPFSPLPLLHRRCFIIPAEGTSVSTAVALVILFASAVLVMTSAVASHGGGSGTVPALAAASCSETYILFGFYLKHHISRGISPSRALSSTTRCPDFS